MTTFILADPRFRPRVLNFLTALQNSAAQAGIRCRSIRHVEPFNGLLVTYGVGREDIARRLAVHVDAGQPAVCIDVGYWGRSFRLAFNGHHPRKLPDAAGDRWSKQGIALRDDYDPNGHIVLVGLGPKSRHMDRTWEADALERIRKAYPGRRVLYRPKPRREFVPLVVETDNISSIEDVLRGASLVVTRHSNVGVDACIAGIPVVAEMGTPALLYSNNLEQPTIPTREQRLDFLRRIAWLNWADEEARSTDLWRFIWRNVFPSRSRTG